MLLDKREKEMIEFYVIKKEEALNCTNDKIPENWIDEYLGHRPGIFDDVDIFCENIRSKDQEFKNFSFFQRVNEVKPETVVICPIYLELYVYGNIMHCIPEIISYYCEKYKNNKVIFQWNSDNDFVQYNDHVIKYPNCRILNFNTSSKSNNDILLPFWVINTKQYKEKKKYFMGFVGRLNSNTRQTLCDKFRGISDFFCAEGLSKEDYYKTSSSIIFNLCPKGVGLSSYRFYESFHLNTVPVLLADDSVLPYEDVNYDDICIRIEEKYIHNPSYVINILKSTDIDKKLNNINNIRKRFTLFGLQEYIHRILIKEK